jgi:glycosyltransferase involved in cell wall biosynthesis
VFDAQIRYLVSRGYLVVNVFVDHLPRLSEDRQARIRTLLDESFSKTRPHLHFVAERKLRTPSEAEAWLRNFEVLSPVGRTGALLADATVDDEAQLAWCGRKTSFVLLNHLYHFGFHNRFTSAPVVLETHDIMTDLYDSHEIPPFVPLEPDSRELRFTDEEGMWRAVDAAVNLSPTDAETVAPHVTRNFLARPYADPHPRTARSWRQVIADNRLEAVLSEHDRFDVMMWGTPHMNNLKSIEWFFDAVVPLDSRLQRLRILILGRITERFSDALRQRAGLTLLGPVDYVEDFFDRADILVIPDLEGTGSSIKLLDTLARGCCFVASASGMRGLDAAAAGYTPSRTPADFAADLTALLASGAARDCRRAVARAIYQANFSREAYEKIWDRVLDSIDQPFRLR